MVMGKSTRQVNFELTDNPILKIKVFICITKDGVHIKKVETRFIKGDRSTRTLRNVLQSKLLSDSSKLRVYVER